MNSECRVNFPPDVWRTLSDTNCHVWIIGPKVNVPVHGGRTFAAPPHFRESSRRARAILLWLASKYVRKAPDELEMGYGEGGKPYFIKLASFGFSLSHTRDWVAIAFAGNRSVGVDIELCSRSVDAAALATRYFHKSEAEYLRGVPDGEKQREFLRLWVLKEAAVKAWGRGIARDLSGAVTHRENDAGAWRVGEGASACMAREFEFAGVMGAIATPCNKDAFRVSLYAPAVLE